MPLEGYVWLADNSKDGLAQTGKAANCPCRRKAPYSFVDHSIEAAVLAKWTGKIRRLRVLP